MSRAGILVYGFFQLLLSFDDMKDVRNNQGSLVRDLLQVLVNAECDLQRAFEASHSRLKQQTYTRTMSLRSRYSKENLAHSENFKRQREGKQKQINLFVFKYTPASLATDT